MLVGQAPHLNACTDFALFSMACWVCIEEGTYAMSVAMRQMLACSAVYMQHTVDVNSRWTHCPQ